MMIMMVDKELIKDLSYISDWSNLFRLAISTCKYEQISTGKCEQITTCKYEKNINLQEGLKYFTELQPEHLQALLILAQCHPLIWRKGEPKKSIPINHH